MFKSLKQKLVGKQIQSEVSQCSVSYQTGGVEVTLLTGGCGFIGSFAVNLLLEEGRHVVVIDRMDICACPREVPEKYKHKYELIVGDITNYPFLMRIFRKYNIVDIFHFAAETHVDNSYIAPFRFTHSNVVGTQTLLECCVKVRRPKRFVHVSTDEVYGTTPENGQASDENSPLDPTNPYSASKVAAEALVRGYGHSFDLDWVMARGNNAYGPGQYPEKVVPRWSLQAIAGEPFTLQGDGKQTRSFIYVEDFARAVLSVYHKGVKGEVYNIGGCREVELLELAQRIHTMSGRTGEPKFENIPDRSFNDLRYIISDQKISNLGWKPLMDFQEGLQITFDFYEKHAASHWEGGQWMGGAIDAKRWLVWGGDSFVGMLFCKYLESRGEIVVHSHSKAERAEEVTSEIWSVRPDNCLFAEEDHGENEFQSVRDNWLAPYTVATICSRAGVHLTFLGSGSIFTNGGKHSEQDTANATSSDIGIIRGSIDSAMHLFSDSVLNTRLVQPLSSHDSARKDERNLINNLISKETPPTNAKTSISVLDDLLPCLYDLAASRKTGTVNLVNPGVISTQEVTQMYKLIVDRSVEAPITEQSDDDVILATSLLEEFCNDVRPVRRAVGSALERLAHSSSSESGGGYPK
eukprot:gene622-336_t